MVRMRLLWRLYLSCLLITLVCLLSATAFAAASLRRFHHARAQADLAARATLIREQLPVRLLTTDHEAVSRLCAEVGRKSETRITVVLPDGRVVGDSHADATAMENHGDRPEIQAAMRGEDGAAVRRWSPTLKQTMAYFATPLHDDEGKVVGVLRTAVSLSALDDAVRGAQIRISLAGAALAVIASGISLLVARQISQPLEKIRHGVERFARGQLEQRLFVSGYEEVESVAAAFNQMAAELTRRLQTVLEQRAEREAVLASMVEGILAIDMSDRILLCNRAAGQLLGVHQEEVSGRPIHDVIRNLDFLRFLERVRSEDGSARETELVLDRQNSLLIQARGTQLSDANGRRFGCLVVLNDITRLKQLERLRRDFVANVSHELRTPITSIKGFLEALRENAVENSADAQRFLDIIGRQVDRLNAIIEDLLTLSYVEQQADTRSLHMEDSAVAPVLESAAEACSVAARARQIDVRIDCPPDLHARMNSVLLEQAVVNLLDNAIKYSEPGHAVHVAAARSKDWVTISVDDEGSGVEPQHLPRLFERFYRVDAGRSRKLGGTGLGLAIVKHIAQAHGGTVSADSVPGKGSTFRIHLPAA